MKYHEMTKNYFFREFDCWLSIENTAKLCFKNMRTVMQWDKGKMIPNECRKLMKIPQNLKLSTFDEWERFYVKER